MKRNLGDTSNIERISIVSSADGSPVTGLDNTSAGLIISTIASNEAAPTVYTVAGGNVETIATLGTYAAPTASKCRFKEIDATNHPGDYEIQLADARYAVALSVELLITASGVTDMLKTDLRVQLNVDDVRLAGSVTHGDAAAVLLLDHAVMDRQSGIGVALALTGNGIGSGVKIIGGADSGAGLSVEGGAPHGLAAEFDGIGNGNGIDVNAGSGAGTTLYIGGSGTGRAVHIEGGVTSGDAIGIFTTNGHGIDFSGVSGAGKLQVNAISHGTDDKALISADAQDRSASLDVNIGAVDGSTAAATRLKLFSEFGSYPDGLVVVDTTAGTAGSTDYENGTMLNPVLTFADAISIAGSIPGIRGYMSLPDTTILLSQDFPFTLFRGAGWTLQTAGYDLSNAYVNGAFVDGQISTSDTQNSNFSDCILWGHTSGSAVLRDCAIANDFTLGETNGSYTLWNCKEAGGLTQAAINYNASGSNNVNAFDFTGTLEIKNMAAGDTLTLIGAGSLIIAASCTGGTITRIGGAIPYTDNSGGAVAIASTDGNYTTELGLQLVNYVRGRKVLSKTGLVWSITVYDHTDDVTPILVKAIKDYLGNDIDDLVAKQLAIELKSSV